MEVPYSDIQLNFTQEAFLDKKKAICVKHKKKQQKRIKIIKTIKFIKKNYFFYKKIIKIVINTFIRPKFQQLLLYH
jgi:hypothetical protein